VVEAAGIEPASKVWRKERWRATSVARARISAESVAHSSPLESPTVPWSPPQSWRHFGDGYHVHDGHFDWSGLTPRGDRVAPHRPFRTASRDLRRSRGKRRFDPGRRVDADPRDRCASRPGARETRTPHDETASVGGTSDTAGGGSPRGRSHSRRSAIGPRVQRTLDLLFLRVETDAHRNSIHGARPSWVAGTQHVS
jgi:hypothetical protein